MLLLLIYRLRLVTCLNCWRCPLPRITYKLFTQTHYWSTALLQRNQFFIMYKQFCVNMLVVLKGWPIIGVSFFVHRCFYILVLSDWYVERICWNNVTSCLHEVLTSEVTLWVPNDGWPVTSSISQSYCRDLAVTESCCYVDNRVSWEHFCIWLLLLILSLCCWRCAFLLLLFLCIEKLQQ